MRGKDKLERLSKTGLTYEKNDGIKVAYLKYGTQGHAQILDCPIKKSPGTNKHSSLFWPTVCDEENFLTLILRVCFSKLFATVFNSTAEEASVFGT